MVEHERVILPSVWCYLFLFILLRGWPGARNVIRKRSDSKDRRAADRKLRCEVGQYKAGL